jgi:cardiolipin synthase C
VAGGRWRLLWTLLLCAWLAGCGTLPPREPAERSRAMAPQADSPLVAVARASMPPQDDLSGFRLLPHGAYALDARLELVRRARHALDVQYYLLDNDTTGRLLLKHLLNAAQRGVRVRLLVDDLFTDRSQRLLSDLDAHPLVEVRLFNPFCCARDSALLGRTLASLLDVRRINHRMHNKLLVADGVIAITGGRNIADEYFLRNETQNFVDMDALVLGRAVADLSGFFDEYWNSTVVYPIDRVLSPDDGLAAAARVDRLAAATAGEQPSMDLPGTDVLGYGPVGEELDDGRLGLIWGVARVYADPPDKRSKNAELAAQDSLTYEALMTVWRAERELTITSPYLIPGDRGIEAFQALGRRQVKTTVLTNSLAATDEPLVHTGYARYRVRLLQAGVDLYELSPQRTGRERRLGLLGSSIGRLHAKTAIIDRRTVFIGSMNLDPRSFTQNTELGMFVDSPALARELQRVINISRLQSAYRVRLAPQGGHLQWLYFDDQGETITEVEPESSLWQRVYNMLIAPLVPEQLL